MNTARTSPSEKKRLLIVGNGMAGGRLLDELIAQKALERYEITVFGEEQHGNYNRILLSKVLAGKDASHITLKSVGWYRQAGVIFKGGVRATHINLEDRTVQSDRGGREPFDKLVIATGSRAFVPPVEGLRNDDEMKEGAFVFRTIDDCVAIRAAARPHCRAVVVGGGLLGLEAAKGLADMGASVVVLDRAEHLMNRQLDETAGRALGREVAKLGIECLPGAQLREIVGDTRVEALRLTDRVIPCDLLVFSCGISPRVELAVASGLPVKRAIVVNEFLEVDGQSDIYAVGECAEINGQSYGIVAPIWDQVAVLAKRLLDSPVAGFVEPKLYTRLKVAGVDVVSMGAVDAESDDEVIQVSEPKRNVYRKLIVRDDKVVGAQFVGDASAAARVIQIWDNEARLPPSRLDVLCSEDVVGAATSPGEREVCNCNRVGESAIKNAIAAGAVTVEAIGAQTRAGTSCGSCRGEIALLLERNAPRRLAVV